MQRFVMGHCLAMVLVCSVGAVCTGWSVVNGLTGRFCCQLIGF